MQIKVDDILLFELTPIQEQVIKNDINADEFIDDMKRRLQYVLIHKYEQSFKRLREEWEPILIAKGATQLPTSKDDFSQLVFADPDYKDRKQRDTEIEELNTVLE